MKHVILLFLSVCVLTCFGQKLKYVKYAKPIIGTAGTGHTFPGATVPFGLVQLSPETGFVGWEYCAGYRYEDTRIYGFAHTHLSGTGLTDLGDLLMMPFTGDPRDSLYSEFSHGQEQAEPGYYEVFLPRYRIKAQLTATPHVGLHQYTFPKASKAGIVVNLKSALVNKAAQVETHLLQSELSIQDKYTLTGYTLTNGWAGKQHFYFVIKLQQPIAHVQWLSDSLENKNQVMALFFDSLNGLSQQIKVGISTVSIENAERNLRTELAHWDFEKTRKQASMLWEEKLKKIEIEGTKAQKEIFYTAMYHSFIAPNNIADINGEYRGADNRVYVAKNKTYLSTLSLWDTYRALNPLYTIIDPDITRHTVNSMLAHEKVQGYLPIWTLWGHENHCMIANHSIPIIAEAYIKGICKDNLADALRSVVKTSTVSHKGSDWENYLKYGYLPNDLVKTESVSKTLESGYDDYAVAKLATLMGDTVKRKQFEQRSNFYKNLYDPVSGLMRGKTSTGQWAPKFDPLKLSHAGTGGGDYTEGNAWQYTWHVQHDVPGLIKLMGGPEKFCSKLDSLFALKSNVYGDGLTVDVTGLIGQYAHGNEPCHHVAYLYAMAGQPWKTSDKIAEITNKFYQNTPDGICGNDDCGQMSAWYIFSTLGFYPVDPVSATYVFGRPLVQNAHIKLGDQTFSITAKNFSEDHPYIQEILLNGQPYYKTYLSHADLIAGGELTFVMGKNKTVYTKKNK